MRRLALAPLLLAAPAVALDSAALKATLDDVVARSALARARAGICVLALESGEVVYARDPDTLLNPASNAKLLTTAAALSRLGPEYRFETEFWVLAGAKGAPTLFVRGKGDPSMTTERLWSLAGEVRLRGVRAVRDLVVDDSFFDGEREAPGYDQERGDRAYLAPAGALSLNGNTVAIHVAPGAKEGEKGRVELDPASDHLELVNRTVTVNASGRRRIVPHTQPAGAREQVIVEGRLPLGSRDLTVWRKVDDPSAYFGHTLRRLLELRGVRMAGRLRRGEVPREAKLLLAAESEPLAEIVRRLNKASSNFMAEQILKVLGAEAKGPPGTWAKGIAAGEEALAGLGLPRGAYVWKNGSGLNDTNRVSARQTATLLREMWRRFPLMPEFVASLPVAGRDGTIRFRMEGSAAEGRLRAKTGTLEGVTGLSGYVEAGSGERLVFAVLVNDNAERAGPVVRAVDALGTALAAAGRPAAFASARPAEVDALDDLRSRAATYYRLGAAADRRNLAFLRTAVRTERDPAVRMAAAEATYLSDPDSDAARRAFLEAVVTDAGTLTRLRTLAGDLGVPLPVLGSLADLAAEGSGDAVAKLLEAAPAAATEPGLAAGYDEALLEAARSAPVEFAAGLRLAPPAAAEAALASLARGLARPGEERHPLLGSLRDASADADEARAAAASEVARRLAAAIASIRAPGKGSEAASPGTAPPAVAPPGTAERRQGG